MSTGVRDRVAIVGGGPAGLMAAEVLCAAGVGVDLYDAMPSLGRKFLMAGKSGLNLTHAEPDELFATRFMGAEPFFQEILKGFTSAQSRNWATELGIETFVGSSGRVFPKEMKAAPLLRAWIHRLRGQGMVVHTRHKWRGWTPDGGLVFETQAGEALVHPKLTVLALGGASWPKLGSDAAWVDWLKARSVKVTPLSPSNCGFDLRWSAHLLAQHEGAPLKGIALSIADHSARGSQERADGGALVLGSRER